MAAKPRKSVGSAVLALGAMLLLVLAATCKKPSNNTAAVAPADTALRPPQAYVQCNQGNAADRVTRVVLMSASDTVAIDTQGRTCGIIWDEAVNGDIPYAKVKPPTATRTTSVCIWTGNHWVCSERAMASSDTAAKAAVKK